MRPVIGKEYNMISFSGAAKSHPNPIFRATCISEDDPNMLEYTIEVTEYNITNLYKPGERINEIDGFRFESIVDRSNKGVKHMLEKLEDE